MFKEFLYKFIGLCVVISIGVSEFWGSLELLIVEVRLVGAGGGI